MTQQIVENLNKQISYEKGKIQMESGKGYTSELMKYLYSIGYRASTSGIMHYLRDANGNLITEGHSWVYLLFNTAKIMA